MRFNVRYRRTLALENVRRLRHGRWMMSNKKCVSCNKGGVLLYVCDDCIMKHTEKKTGLDKHFETCEDIIKLHDNVVDMYQELSRAQKEEDQIKSLNTGRSGRELAALVLEARLWAEHYIKASEEANDALIEHGIEMTYSELPLTGIPPWKDK